MKDYQLAALRFLGVVIMVVAGLVGAATCGDAYGRAHAGDKP